MVQFNNRIRQVIILLLIVMLGYLIINQLYIFVPGFLGAITLYILGRGRYYHMVFKRKWNPKWTAMLYILIVLIALSIPVYFTIRVMVPKINAVFGNSEEIMAGVHKLSERVAHYTGIQLFARKI
jgi:hypothetical protein